MSRASDDHARARRIAQENLSHPAFLKIVQAAVDGLNANPGKHTDVLASHLAYAYARGVINGWRARESHRGDVIPFLPPEATI